MSEDQADWVDDLWDQLTLHWKKVVAVIVVGLIVGTIWDWRKGKTNEAELAGSHEVWQMQMSNTVSAAQWERAASAHDGTSASGRALLLSAESYFMEAQRGLAVVSRAETTATEAKEAATRTLKEAREEVANLERTWEELKAAAAKASMKAKMEGKDAKASKEDKDKAAKESEEAGKKAEEAKANHDKAVEDRLKVASEQLEQAKQDIKDSLDEREDAEVAAKSAFSSARQRFEQFLGDYGQGHPLAATATLGKATCLDELGDPGAADVYQDVLNQFGQEMVAIQAKLALAMLFEESGKSADAKKLLEDVEKTDLSQFWGRRAQILRGRLLERHPELKNRSNLSTNTPIPSIAPNHTNKPSTNSSPEAGRKPTSK